MCYELTNLYIIEFNVIFKKWFIVSHSSGVMLNLDCNIICK